MPGLRVIPIPTGKIDRICCGGAGRERREGSEIAAPFFRRIIETYYFGEPQKLYRGKLNST
jgi:hypothetical protein